MPTTNNKAGGKRRGMQRSGSTESGPTAGSRAARTGLRDQRAHMARREAKASSREQAVADRAWLEAEDRKVKAVVAEWMTEVRAWQAAARAAGEPVPPVPPLHDPSNRSAGDLTRWTVGQARLLLEDGYALAKVCQQTGWGGWWFRDLVGHDGYVRRPTTGEWVA